MSRVHLVHLHLTPQYTHSETVQTVDRTSQLIQDIGSVECTPSIPLSSVLHVSSFLVNLLRLVLSLTNSNAVSHLMGIHVYSKRRELGRGL